ncbi:MAG: hypothetical protein L0Y58_20070 [Verrucomicrobia subdivision 3 bacterium]|nr:hypothetical protein [Limisphaerales bacterium]
MMYTAKQHEVLEGMACFLGLGRVEPRTTGALRLDVTNFTDNRAAGMHDGGVALWVSATIARKCK